MESSPKRKEMMSHDTAVKCMDILANSPSVKILDLTGIIYISGYANTNRLQTETKQYENIDNSYSVDQCIYTSCP